jgi:hypothetical protein
VLVVPLDDSLEPMAIYEAKRPAIGAALRLPGSKARNLPGDLKCWSVYVHRPVHLARTP